MNMSVDAATVEIIKNRIIHASREAYTVLARTSSNPIIYEGLDFSVGLLSPKAELVAQAAGLPQFLGNLGVSIKSIVNDIGGFEAFEPGDIYMTNDIYTACLHLPDMTICSPIFLKDELVGFTFTRAHWWDIGSSVPIGGIATDRFQEGVTYKSVRLYERGKLNESIMRIILSNTRLRDFIASDVNSQVAACRIGEKRYLAIIEKYGKDTLMKSINEMLAHGEKTALNALKQIPNGEYVAEGYADNDGIKLDVPLKVKVKVVVDEDEMTIDLTGSNSRCKGNVNAGIGQTITACRTAYMNLIAPNYPINEGLFRPLKLVIPEDTIFNAKEPDSTMFSWMPLEVAIDLVFTALSPVIPNRVVAPNYGSSCISHIHGIDPKNKKLIVWSDTEGGGWGAKPFDDGENAILFGDTRNTPIEFMENRYPLMVERYELRQDSGGPGRYRGGLGIRKDYRILAEEARGIWIFERAIYPPWGILGGKEAVPSNVVVNPGTPGEEAVPKQSDYPLKRGDIVSLRTAGGGGYGSPSERKIEKIESDILNGYISIDHAIRFYEIEYNAQTNKITRKGSEN